MRLTVLKVGGRSLSDPGWLARLAAAVAARAARSARAEAGADGVPSCAPAAARPAGQAPALVLVHGGGPEIDALSARLGIPVERRDGRRVTSLEALDVAAMVLSGRVNKRLVTALLDAGADALGLSGEDGGLLLAEPEAGGALGRVGRIVRVRAALLRDLLALGLLPVVSPISRGTDGAPLNVNADDAAAAIAVACHASELLFLTDVEGVRDGEAACAELTPARAAALVARGVARDGMGVKLSAALAALDGGVPVVRIGTLSILEGDGAGTLLHAAAEARA